MVKDYLADSRYFSDPRLKLVDIFNNVGDDNEPPMIFRNRRNPDSIAISHKASIVR